MILKTLEGCALGGDGFSQADRLHLIAEATKAAYYVRDSFIGDPDFVDNRVEYFLSEDSPSAPAARSGSTAPLPPQPWDGIEHKDTIYLCVVDRDGNAVSFINSLFSSFGTGIMAPESGVILHNRGSGFRIDARPPERASRRSKRPFHTLIPGMLVKDGRAVMPFGVMGGQFQAVGHADLPANLLDHGMDPQQAAEAPRVFAYQGGRADRALRRRAGARRSRDARPRDRDARRADRRLPGDLDRPRPRRPDRRLRPPQGRLALGY